MIAGDDIRIFGSRCSAAVRDDDLRNRQAFGAGTVSLLRGLRVAGIGCSGTGSIVIEQLARLGVGEFVLIDPDIIEIKNLNRILNATRGDAEREMPKVLVAKRTIDALGRGQTVLPLQINLDSVEAVHRVAECDVIFGCVDTAEGRNLANRIAAYYVIPYIDVGVRLVADGKDGVESVAGAVHYCKPGGLTLLERGAITTEQIRAEELLRTDPVRYRELRRQRYIMGVDEDRPAVISINAFFAALAVNEFLARVHLFRNVENSESSTVRGDLCEFVLYREAEEGSKGHLVKEVGAGDCEPLLGRRPCRCCREQFLGSLVAVGIVAVASTASVPRGHGRRTTRQIEEKHSVCDRRWNALAGCAAMPLRLRRHHSAVAARIRIAALVAAAGERWNSHAHTVGVEKQRLQVAFLSEAGRHSVVRPQNAARYTQRTHGPNSVLEVQNFSQRQRLGRAHASGARRWHKTTRG